MSNKDFTADFSEGEHYSPGLHDAGIEPSGKGEDISPIQQQINSDAKTIAMLSRQLLRSEQKNQAKDEEIQRLREALDKIVSMKLKPGETDYKYAFNRIWHIALEALNPSSKTDKS